MSEGWRVWEGERDAQSEGVHVKGMEKDIYERGENLKVSKAVQITKK